MVKIMDNNYPIKINRSISCPVVLLLLLITSFHFTMNYMLATTEFYSSRWLSSWEIKDFANILRIYFNIYSYQLLFLIPAFLFSVDIIRRKTVSASYLSWFISLSVLIQTLWCLFSFLAFCKIYSSPPPIIL